jgi:hypothetical protein
MPGIAGIADGVDLGVASSLLLRGGRGRWPSSSPHLTVRAVVPMASVETLAREDHH